MSRARSAQARTSRSPGDRLSHSASLKGDSASSTVKGGSRRTVFRGVGSLMPTLDSTTTLVESRLLRHSSRSSRPEAQHSSHPFAGQSCIGPLGDLPYFTPCSVEFFTVMLRALTPKAVPTLETLPSCTWVQDPPVLPVIVLS